ncbi:uncharacterized protein LOC117111460 [Anneissia japonica]|uniref:uncharacterized protein LOC117111460 n=1 Tax=Anneissia japonica TaxID=1529436 RepID=UPI0014257C2C|nr:uncharacterized protein LOC117111460 [Anneissia japonica]XP_033110275.1 uncharacterized protein LOC117111460 [Anneissia japonica]
MSSRAIHIEPANSLETDAFINALRRFLNVRGPIRQIRSDRGTNFVGANNVMMKGLKEVNQSKVMEFLLRQQCDWIGFKFNVPAASHMGGVWERQIRTVRSVLEPLLRETGTQLDDESFRTLLTEVQNIVNSRPLTTDNLSDHNSPEPLTPNHLLTLKSKILLPPPGIFQRPDLYSRQRWRRVQHLSNEFWYRWRREYFQTLQPRQKWTKPERNLHIGDVVIIKDDNQPRNYWQLGRVDLVYPSDDGLVRKVKLLVGNPNLDQKGRRKQAPSYLDRPIQKLVLLVPASEA